MMRKGGKWSLIPWMLAVAATISSLCHMARSSMPVSRSMRASAKYWMENIQLPAASDMRRICNCSRGSSSSMLVWCLASMEAVRVSSFLEQKAMEKSLGIKESKAWPVKRWAREGVGREAIKSSLMKGARGGKRDRQ